MKVALITGGQPRFTKYWIENYKRLVGASQIDLYFYLWKDFELTDSQLNFSDIEGTIEQKIESVLIKNVNLRQIVWTDNPAFENIINERLIYSLINVNHLDTYNKVETHLKKLLSQRYSILQCFNLLKENYDAIIRYRLDCYPDRKINLNENVIENTIVIPSNNIHGGIAYKSPGFNDKYAIGNMKIMKIYCEMFNYFEQLINEEPLTVQEETGLGYHLIKKNIEIKVGDFNYHLIREGY